MAACRREEPSGASSRTGAAAPEGSLRMLRAYHNMKIIRAVVSMAQQISLYPIPEKSGSPDISWAMPTVKGLRKAAEKPMLDATYTTRRPVMAS